MDLHTDPAHRSLGRRALLLEDVHPRAVELLEQAGVQVDHRTRAMTEDELVEAVRGVDLLGIRSATRVTARVLSTADRLCAVGAFCAGTNQIDLRAAAARGVHVLNAPHSNTRSVVELAVADLLVLNRRLTEKDRETHAGRWSKTARGSRELRGQRLGIVGYGSIGSQLSVVAEALGMSVVFHDLVPRQPIGGARSCATLDELLAQSDAVSLHVDGRPENAGLIGADELRRMPAGSVLLNLSRGSVVDVAALRSALLDGHLAGAAVDVHPDEPRAVDQPFRSVLQGCPNVVLTPHVGGSTAEAQRDIGQVVGSALVEHLRGARQLVAA